MAEKKMQGAIKAIFLDDNTFHGVTINPTLINYFYGKNGSGKSTIARLIRSKSGITPDISNFEVLVYDQDFIAKNIKEDAAMPGIFSLNEGNIEIQNKVAELNGERDKLAVQYQEKKNALTDAKEKLPALRIALESSCWETTACKIHTGGRCNGLGQTRSRVIRRKNRWPLPLLSSASSC